jgi:hypothetical protein
MSRVAVLLQFILLLSMGVAFSQDDIGTGGRDIGLSLGAAEYQVRENVLNRIRHRGALISGGFFIESTGEISRQKFEFYLVFSKLKSRYDPDKSSFAVNPSLHYRYARKIKNINPAVTLFVGGVLGLDMHHEWFDNWDDSHLYWLTSYYLGGDGILTYRRSDTSSFVLEVYMPLLALISRPPERFLYKTANPDFSWVVGELHSNMRLTSIHEHLALNLNLRYRFRYTHIYDQSIYWRLSYTRNTVPYSKELSILTHTLGISFIF